MAGVENGIFIGFIVFREFNAYVYSEHFSVNRNMRGKEDGSRLLADIIEKSGKTVLLEIDPLEDDVSKARLAFYQRSGFIEKPYPRFHPPYCEGFAAHPLIVLTPGQPLPGMTITHSEKT